MLDVTLDRHEVIHAPALASVCILLRVPHPDTRLAGAVFALRGVGPKTAATIVAGLGPGRALDILSSADAVAALAAIRGIGPAKAAAIKAEYDKAEGGAPTQGEGSRLCYVGLRCQGLPCSLARIRLPLVLSPSPSLHHCTHSPHQASAARPSPCVCSGGPRRWRTGWLRGWAPVPSR